MINTGKIYKSLEAAITILETSIIKKNEVIIIPYYSSSLNDIDALVAVGTQNGNGPGSYSIVSLSGIQVVTFTTQVPDSSYLKNGELYIWSSQDDGCNYKVYLSERTRIIEKITSEIFVSDKSGSKFYVTEKEIKKFSELATKQDIIDSGMTEFLTLSEFEELSTGTQNNPDNIFFICKNQSKI